MGSPRPIADRAADGVAPPPVEPLGDRLTVQVFGFRDSQATRKALRFFRERRVELSFVDLAKRSLAPAELRRFSQRFAPDGLVDQSSRPYREGGLAWLRLNDDELAGRLLDNPRLLRLPLVRAGNRLAVGDDEAGWRASLGAAVNSAD